jgi:hypothetical protein
MLELQLSTPANAPAGKWTVKQKAQIFTESFEPGQTCPRSLDDTENRTAGLRIATKLGGVKAPTFATYDGLSIGVGFMQSEAAPSATSAIQSLIDGPTFPKRLPPCRARNIDCLCPPSWPSKAPQ